MSVGWLFVLPIGFLSLLGVTHGVSSELVAHPEYIFAEPVSDSGSFSVSISMSLFIF